MHTACNPHQPNLHVTKSHFSYRFLCFVLRNRRPDLQNTARTESTWYRKKPHHCLVYIIRLARKSQVRTEEHGNSDRIIIRLERGGQLLRGGDYLGMGRFGSWHRRSGRISRIPTREALWNPQDTQRKRWLRKRICGDWILVSLGHLGNCFLFESFKWVY